ncbi:MAG: hypothetical protein ABW023_12290 [Sphingomonas sp.]
MAEAVGEYCDLVMKGGITSGLVYPTAAIALAKKYRFKNVGGTSAGAIAAAACAAAALGERRKELSRTAPAGAGFAGLEKVAHDLSSRGFIYRLFQPSFGSRSVYHLLVVATGRKGLFSILFGALRAMTWAAGLEFVLVLAALLGLGYWIDGWPGLYAAALPAILCATAAGSLFGLMRVARVARRNFMGICTGMAPRPLFGKARPALTEWLHGIIQALSGQPADQPLLFEHLWGAPRYPAEPATEKTLSLRVITTSISHHEPRSLPIEKNGGRFWFREEDFERLFPKTVVTWMIGPDPKPVVTEGTRYFPLPAEGKLPVIVAARMSLSFPLLVSAIPLFEPVFGEKVMPAATETQPLPRKQLDAVDALATGGDREGRPIPDGTPFRICWFSDGGISSNFPIHLFDAPLPRWPTFAIDLVNCTTDDGPESQVGLPQSNNEGWRPRYQSIARWLALSELGAFLFGIIGTMQNWRDLLQSRAPGHRERIVTVPLTKAQGGLNLDMPAEILRAVADKGNQAGEALWAFDFDNHWWIRWRNVAGTSERFLNSFAVGAAPPISQSYAKAYRAATTGSAPPSYKLTRKEHAEAQQRFSLLSSLGQNWGTTTPSLAKTAPRPQPQMTIAPTY